MSEVESTTATPAGGTGHGARRDDLARDDLARIGGIDAVAADRLALAGIRTYPELARRSPEELAGISGLPLDRAMSWPSQARELAAATDGPAPRPVSADETGHHYESFVWRLLLDERGAIRHTSVQHVQTGEVKRWAWWNREALLDFVESRAAAGGTRDESGNTAVPATAVPDTTGPDTTGPDTTGPNTTGPDSTGPGTAVPETAGPEPVASAAGADQAGGSPFVGAIGGSLGIDRAEVLPARPMTMIVTLDLAATNASEGGRGNDGPEYDEWGYDRFGYDATVVARRLPDDARTLVGRATGMLDAARPVILVAGEGPPAGLYRLEAAVALRGPDGRQFAAAMIEGILLEIPAEGTGTANRPDAAD